MGMIRYIFHLVQVALKFITLPTIIYYPYRSILYASFLVIKRHLDQKFNKNVLFSFFCYVLHVYVNSFRSLNVLFVKAIARQSTHPPLP